MRPRAQNLAAAGALGSAPFQKQLALVAALVAVAVVAAVFLSGGFVCKAGVPARHPVTIVELVFSFFYAKFGL